LPVSRVQGHPARHPGRSPRTSRVTLDGVTLDGVTLDGVTLDGVTLDGVTLDGVTLDGVTLDGVRPGRLAILVKRCHEMRVYGAKIVISAPWISRGHGRKDTLGTARTR